MDNSLMSVSENTKSISSNTSGQYKCLLALLVMAGHIAKLYDTLFWLNKAGVLCCGVFFFG